MANRLPAPLSLSAGEVEEFLRSMPPSYRSLFDVAEVFEHAQIVRRRGTRSAHVEVWRTLPRGEVALCFVAEDRPALLSLIGTALVEFGLDVTRAEIYCRTTLGGPIEAVDLFWVRATARDGQLRAIETSEIERLSQRLSVLINEPLTVDSFGIPSERPKSLDPIPTSRVYYDPKALSIGQYVLVVEAHDRPGLLLSVVRALHRRGVDIVASEVRTENLLVRDRFTIVDSGGQALSEERRQAVKDSVNRALHGSGHRR